MFEYPSLRLYGFKVVFYDQTSNNTNDTLRALTATPSTLLVYLASWQVIRNESRMDRGLKCLFVADLIRESDHPSSKSFSMSSTRLAGRSCVPTTCPRSTALTLTASDSSAPHHQTILSLGPLPPNKPQTTHRQTPSARASLPLRARPIP